jgi:hypothetical protein
MLNAGSPTSRSRSLSGPVEGAKSNAQDTVLRMPGMMSGTMAAAPANAFAGVFVRATSHASPNPTVVQTMAVAPAYPNEFAISVPKFCVVNVST